MRSLRILIAAATAMAAHPAGAQAVANVAAVPRAETRSAAHPYAAHVADAARRFGIPEAWIWAVMHVESRADPRAVSPAGAMGLMQIMPATWAALRARLALGNDPFDVRDNIMAGAAYLRAMHDRYGDPAAMLAAYNAGPGRYDDYLARGRPLPGETRAYLARLAPMIGGAGDVQLAVATPPDPLAWRRAAIFVRAGTAALSNVAYNVAYSAGGEPAAADAQRGGEASDAAPAPQIPAPSQTDSLFVRRPGPGRPQ